MTCTPSGKTHSLNGRLWSGNVLAGFHGKRPVCESRPLALTRATIRVTPTMSSSSVAVATLPFRSSTRPWSSAFGVSW